MNTILWAINSKCNFHCKYCYLDFPEENNPVNNINLQKTSDIGDKEISQFIEQFEINHIKRVFIAGAEPLSNPKKTFEIIKKIKKMDIQVILCTNGYLIENYCEQMIESNIDAVSISLDSHKKQYNDKYRGYPTSDGFEKVVNGIKVLKKKSDIKVGIYTVLTRLNYIDLKSIYNFVSNLNVDYFVFQPIFLNQDSELYNQLVLGGNEYEKLSNIIKNLYKNETNTKLPNKEYIKMMLDAIIHKEKVIYNCFAGDSLFFLTPDGAIHPCPSSKIIPNEKETIKVHENRLKDIFINKKIKIKKCNKFSEDCVNMWQLMSFDEILQ